ARAAVDLNLIVLIPDLRVAGRQDEILGGQRIRDIHRRKLLRVELIGIDVHHYLAELPAVWQRHGRALDRRELGADEILSEIEKLLLAQRLAFQAKLDDRNARCVVLNNAGRGRSRRENLEQSLRNGSDLRERNLDLRVWLKVHSRYGNAAVRLR